MLAGLLLAGKSVIDLRAQRGDNLRRALRAGASYAEGIEPALESVNAGRLINSAHGFDSAVLRCADVEETRCLNVDFDVGLCLGDVEFTEVLLAATLPHIRELLLVRISTGENHWFRRQVRGVMTVFPYWSLLPFNEPVGVRSDVPRGLLALGREAHAVAVSTEGRSDSTGLGHPGVRWLDVERSSRALQMMGRRESARAVILDLRRRLSRLAGPDLGELSAAIKPSLPALSLACRELPPLDVDFGTDRYWLRFLQGLVHWIEHQALTLDNPYVRFIRGACALGAYDPGMRYELADGERALKRLQPRILCFLEVLRYKAARQPLVLYNPTSLTSLRAYGYGSGESTPDHHVTFSNGREYRIQCIDGNHRLAALWLCGASQSPVLPVWTNVHGDDPVLRKLPGPGSSAGIDPERLVTLAVHELRNQPAITPSTPWREARTGDLFSQRA